MEKINEFRNLVELVEVWAKEKGILDKATPLSQHGKTEEEVNELGIALLSQKNNLKTYEHNGKIVNTAHEIKDGLGDALVTLIIQAKMQEVSLLECLAMAYKVISKRTGKMKEGVFVKDE